MEIAADEAARQFGGTGGWIFQVRLPWNRIWDHSIRGWGEVAERGRNFGLETFIQFRILKKLSIFHGTYDLSVRNAGMRLEGMYLVKSRLQAKTEIPQCLRKQRSDWNGFSFNRFSERKDQGDTNYSRWRA